MPTDNNNVLRCAVRWRFTGIGDIVNVYDLRTVIASGSVTDADVLSAVTLYMIGAYSDTTLTNLFPTALLHEDIQVFNRTESYPVGYTGRIPALDGDGGGEIDDERKAALVIFRAPVPRKVGKKFLPPHNLSYMEEGLFNATAMGLLEAYADFVMAEFTVPAACDLQYVVAGALPAPNYVPTSYAIRTQPGIMKSRKRGVGS